MTWSHLTSNIPPCRYYKRSHCYCQMLTVDPSPPTSTRHLSGGRCCQAFTIFHALPLLCTILNEIWRTKTGEAWEQGCVYCQMLSITNKCITICKIWFLWYRYRMKLVENLQLTSSCPQHSERGLAYWLYALDMTRCHKQVKLRM